MLCVGKQQRVFSVTFRVSKGKDKILRELLYSVTGPTCQFRRPIRITGCHVVEANWKTVFARLFSRDISGVFVGSFSVSSLGPLELT